MSEVGEVKYKVEVDDSGVDKQIDKTESKLKSKFGSAAKAVGAAAASAIAAGTAAVVSLVKQAAEAYGEFEQLDDVVGRYKVTIGDKEYDTVCVMNVGHFNSRIAIEQYLDKNGRTILWRRFNKNDWAKHRYGKEWTELLPDNERLTINGETYVHWYDCITDYIL